MRQQALTRFLQQHGYLMLAVPPMLVLTLAIGLFEFSLKGAKDYSELTKSLVSDRSVTTIGQVFQESRARYIWLTSVILMLVANLYAIAMCSIVLHRARRWLRLNSVIALAGVLFAASLATVVLNWLIDGALSRGVFGFTFKSLTTARHFYQEPFLTRIRLIMSVINFGCTTMTPSVLIAAMCCMLAPPPEHHSRDPEFVAKRMRTLKELLNISGIIMVAGILHMGAWLNWPAAFVSVEAVQADIRGLSLAITMFWGVTYSIVIAVTFVPGASVLRRRAELALESDPEIDDVEQWLERHGFAVSTKQHLREIAVMLAPALAAPIGDFLS